jgi:uncharacterized protein
MMEVNHNMVGWFEIPVFNMDRAILFYETVFDLKLMRQPMGHLEMAFFPGVEGSIGAGGGLVYGPEYYKPSADGALIYFTAFSGDLAIELDRVVEAGGMVIVPKKLISEEIGYMGVFMDTEGNRIALHCRK